MHRLKVSKQYVCGFDMATYNDGILRYINNWDYFGRLFSMQGGLDGTKGMRLIRRNNGYL